MSRPRHDVTFYVPSIAPLLAGSGQPPGGAETQISLVARALAERGASVAIVAFDTPGLPDDDHGVAVVRRAPHAASPVAEARHIATALRRAPSRTVVTRTAGAHTGIAATVARLLGRRFVYSSANVVDFAFENLEPSRAKRALFHLGVRLADEIVVQTEEQVELCRRRFGREAPLIRSIAEPAALRTARPDSFLWIARVLPYKQPLEYVALARAVPEARFRMVAVPEPNTEEGRRLMEELRAAAQGVANLELLEPRPRAALMELVDTAVAIVSTSTSEGMPNIWLEGWARGIPALTLGHDPDGVVGRRELGGSAGHDPARLAQLTRELWAGRDDQAALAARCRAYIEEEHSPASVADRWAAALQLDATSS